MTPLYAISPPLEAAILGAAFGAVLLAIVFGLTLAVSAHTRRAEGEPVAERHPWLPRPVSDRNALERS